MSGLIDSTTGLVFGSGLEWQTPIGGGGLTIVTTAPTPPDTVMITEAGDAMITQTVSYMVTE